MRWPLRVSVLGVPPIAASAPPSFERAAAGLRAVGARHPDIARLEIFGSVAAGEAKAGSDLDVLIVFRAGQQPLDAIQPHALLELTDEMVAGLGVPVDLHERLNAERCEDPLRRASVLNGARLVYGS